MTHDSTPWKGERWEERALSALAEQLGATRARYDLVVVGGAALILLQLVDRTTKDVDVVGFASGDRVISSKPFPGDLARAVAKVAEDLAIPGDWLNPGPTDLLDFGLPEGFLERTHRVEIGPALVVYLADRLDQIHFKLYAIVDHGGGRHEDDVRSLDPTPEELLAAARWTRTQDPSEGFRGQLILALERLGVPDADVG